MSYKFKEHTADVKFIASETSIEQTFCECANALKESICGNLSVLSTIEKTIFIQATGLENLLYKFLEEFLILLDSESFLLCRIKELSINEKNFSLTAKILGDDANKYSFTNDVKAVTYSQMEVKKTSKGFQATVVLDV